MLSVTAVIIVAWRKELQCEAVAVEMEEASPGMMKSDVGMRRALTFTPLFSPVAPSLRRRLHRHMLLKRKNSFETKCSLPLGDLD